MYSYVEYVMGMFNEIENIDIEVAAQFLNFLFLQFIKCLLLKMCRALLESYQNVVLDNVN